MSYSIVNRLRSSARNLSSRLLVNPEVQEALTNGDPVVALESTIVAHGMPYPQNYQVAREVEEILRSKNVVPATIAVRDGVGRVGLSDEELHDLAQSGSAARKVSTRELSLLMGGAFPVKWGATTVASTMILAHQAGIPTFVTGGVGGVHRGAEVSMDISADLTELSRTPVVVVSAGIKSILDISKTLEVLETLAVPTVTYQADDFPAFFSPTSGVRTPWRVDSVDEVARAYVAARNLGLNHGMLVAVPNYDPAGAKVEDAIQDALQKALDGGVTGQALTPFILKTVAEETEGDSLRSNIALVKNNARVGADLAIALSKMQSGAPPLAGEVERETDHQDQTGAKIIVLGGAVVDIVARPREGSPLLISTSNPGTYIESDGGVGRNVAEALARLGCRPALYTTVGNDDRGRGLLERFEEIGGINHSHIVSCSPTATYLAVLNGAGDLHAAIADMQIFKDMEPPSRMAIRGARFLVMDANPSLVVLEEAARIANENGVQVCLEPTSVPKARLVADNLELLSYISYAFPNSDELFAMADKITDQPGFSGYTPNLKNNTESAAAILLRHMHPTKATLVVSMGEKGVLLATRQGQELSFVNFAVNDPVTLVSNATGAGDSLCGAFLAALLHDKTLREAVEIGMEAGRLSVQTSEAAISPLLNQLRDKLL